MYRHQRHQNSSRLYAYTQERALISLYGPDEALQNSYYFNHDVTGEGIITG